MITKTFDDFCTEYLENPDALDYYQLLAPWNEIFGKENITVKPFEKKQFNNSDLLTDFLNYIGCQLKPTSNLIKNTSPPVEYLETLRTFTTSIKDVNERMIFARIFRQLPIKFDDKKYTFFADEKRKLFLKKFHESNRRVAQEYLGRKKDTLFHENMLSDFPVYPGIKFERFSEIAGNLVLLLMKNSIKHANFKN